MHTLLDLLFGTPDEPADPVRYVSIVFVLVGSIVLHELGHALVASWEGDATPKIRGHLTWNPVVHMGWISLILIAVLGIGWGSTPVNRAMFRHRRWGDVLVSFAGPAVNLALALFGAIVLVLATKSGTAVAERIADFWLIVVQFNVLLFLFNMIPIPPLDGFSVLDGTFDLGGFGALMRQAGMFAFVIAILIVNSDAFSSVWFRCSKALIVAASKVVGS